MLVLVWLTLYALVAFRLSELLVIDDGPFEIFLSVRSWFNAAPYNNGIRRNISNVLMCVHCTGFWISLGLGIIYYFSAHSTMIEAVLFGVAVAGAQSILANKAGRHTT